MKLNYIFRSFRGIFFSLFSKTPSTAQFSGNQFVAEPREEARGNSRGANTTAWRGERDRLPSPAGKAGIFLSGLLTPPRADPERGCSPAPYHSGWERAGALMAVSGMFCVSEAECYYACQRLSFKKEKYRGWTLVSSKLTSASGCLLFDQYSWPSV